MRRHLGGPARRPTAVIFFGLFCLVSLAACDEGETPTEVDGQAPVLSSFSFEPTRATFEQLPPDQIVNDTLARIPIQLSVRAEDPDGCVERVGVVFADARNPQNARTTADLEPREGNAGVCMNGWFEGRVTVDLPRGSVGAYAVRVYAVDETGRLGDQMQGRFHFALQQGEPPVVENVEASADTIRPPTELRFVATVSDPDGRSNIKLVLVEPPNGDVARLNDQGLQGDAVADDGRYTATFNVPDAEPGEFVFTFWAVDKNGLESDRVEKTIVVAE